MKVVFNLKNNNSRGQISIDFLLELFIIGGVGLFLFMTLWNTLAPDTVTEINNLEGTFDAIILVMFFLIPVAAIITVLRFALKPKSPEQGQA